MLTADQIAVELRLDIWVVRYRLSELRRKDRTKAKKFGTTYAYPDSVKKKVEQWGKE